MPLVIGSHELLAKLRWRFTGDAQEMISTIGVRSLGSAPGDPIPTAVEANAIAKKVAKSWSTPFSAPQTCQGWVFAGVDVVGGPDTAGEGNGVAGSYNNFVVGALNDQTLPTNCAILVRKLTGFAGKRNHGRMYLPPAYMSEAAVDGNGMIETDFIDQVGGQLDQFQTALGTADDDGPALEPILFHWVPAVGAGPAATLITDLVCQAQIATQRQRMRR